MGMRKMALVAALGLSMASTPVLAQTSAPIAPVRSSAELTDTNEAFRGTTAYIVAFFVILAIGFGIYAAVNEDDNRPTSP